MHQARARLTALVDQCSSAPILLTRNGRPVAVLASPELLTDATTLDSGERTAVRASLLQALAIIDGGK